MDVDGLIRKAEERRQAGSNGEAIAAFKSAVRAADNLGDQTGLVMALSGLGSVYLETGRDRLAVSALTRAIGIADTEGLPELACAALGNLGSYYRVNCEFGKAEASYKSALRRYEEMEDARGQVSALGYLGMLEESRGDIKTARDYWVRGLSLGEEIAMPDLRYFRFALDRTSDCKP